MPKENKRKGSEITTSSASCASKKQKILKMMSNNDAVIWELVICYLDNVSLCSLSLASSDLETITQTKRTNRKNLANMNEQILKSYAHMVIKQLEHIQYVHFSSNPDIDIKLYDDGECQINFRRQKLESQLSYKEFEALLYKEFSQDIFAQLSSGSLVVHDSYNSIKEMNKCLFCCLIEFNWFSSHKLIKDENANIPTAEWRKYQPEPHYIEEPQHRAEPQKAINSTDLVSYTLFRDFVFFLLRGGKIPKVRFFEQGENKKLYFQTLQESWTEKEIKKHLGLDLQKLK